MNGPVWQLAVSLALLDLCALTEQSHQPCSMFYSKYSLKNHSLQWKDATSVEKSQEAKTYRARQGLQLNTVGCKQDFLCSNSG